LIFVFSFSLQSCSDYSLVKDSICDVTSEICHYATLLCEIESNKNINQELNENIKYQLVNIRDGLKDHYFKASVFTKKQISEDNEALLYELKLYEAQLKQLYELSLDAQ
jgi:hypothetical protein